MRSFIIEGRPAAWRSGAPPHFRREECGVKIPEGSELEGGSEGSEGVEARGRVSRALRCVHSSLGGGAGSAAAWRSAPPHFTMGESSCPS